MNRIRSLWTNLWGHRRQPNDDDWQGQIITETIHDADMAMPTTCDCGAPATHWVEYLWRKYDRRRNEFDAGHTTEDICKSHLARMFSDTDIHIEEWGEL